ncbi:MAG TPA: ATP-binding protein [Candidatus Baltobacteraceae bacterium]|nr:ATP-binding protein [Candidatus Baltobacteraceae bacterium]
MALVSNPDLLAVAFIEGGASAIILVLYWLLIPGFRARFFRFWLAGWTVYVALEALRMANLMRGGDATTPFTLWLSFIPAFFFLAATMECRREAQGLKYLWIAGPIVMVILAGIHSDPRFSSAAGWLAASLLSAVYLSSGWIFWRSQSQHGGIGWKLVSAALMLRGLHGLDRPEWSSEGYEIFRVSFHGLFGIMMGIAMAVLVLEAGRARTEELNEKLRRLSLITAEATHSFRMDQVLNSVLQHLVEILGATHGVVLLLDDAGTSPVLVERASAGQLEAPGEHPRIPVTDSWVKNVLRQSASIVSSGAPADSTVQLWKDADQLASVVLVRVPGKDGPLGLLGIGSVTPRPFPSDEQNFLVNVANLLGLTVQNVELFQSSAASRRQWLDTFDSIDDLILVHSNDGRILRANRALATRLAAEPIALVGRSLRDLLFQGTAPWVVCPYCEGAAGQSEEIDPTFGGYFVATDSSFHDSEGGRLGTIHVLKDFTAHRIVENKFRTLFEKAPEGVFISTPDGRFLDFNEAFMRIVGYETRDELLDTDIPSHLYATSSDRQRLKRLLHEYGEVSDFEFQFRRRDGEIRTARESCFATRDDSGEIVAYQGFVLDVTEHKQAEMDIRRRNRELLALNAIGELLTQCATLEDGLNDALLKVTELSAVDAAAVYFLDESTRTLKRAAAVGYRSSFAREAAPIEVSASLLNQIRQVRVTILSGTAPALPEDFRELHRNEGIQVSQVVVLWTKDRITGVLVVGCREMRAFSTGELNLLSAIGNQIATTIDKSLLLEKTREAYETLRRTQEQLLQSEKMAAVGQLISGVAHELNNPLTAILGYSQLLKSEELMNPRGAGYLEKLYKQAQRTHHIVQNLLSFARQHKPERAPVQLNQILEDTLILREYDMKLSNIVIHREFDPHLPMTGGDFHQLQQVFLNILNNAVDAIQEKGGSGEIWIRTEAVGSRLRVEMTDNGPGVQNPHRIFDPFYTTKAVGKGTGLGLSICYGIVKEHGGEIQVRNAPPRGAAFTITLPLLVVSASAPPAEPGDSAEAPAGKILLVDDEETVLQLEEEILVARGSSVRLARNELDAIDILKRDSVDAVVASANLTDEDSPNLYKWIRKNRPDLAARIVFTISTATEDLIPDLVRNSGCPILRKPFKIDEFCKALQAALAVSVAGGSKR